MPAGCDRRPDDVPVVVSVIGGPAGDGDRTPAGRLLTASIAQGLVRFDGNGGIEPGLAERWIVIDDGRSFIFRLRDAEWPNGAAVRADDVVPVLRRTFARHSRNRLAPYLTAIEEIVSMTPQVIEVRLKRPRPDLLNLFAQPELTIPAPVGRGGSGPFRIVRTDRAGVLLRPVFDPARAGEDAEAPAPEAFVRLRGERAGVAILRFVRRQSDLVEGGSLIDWPLVALAGVARANVRIDAAAGLFGFAIARRDGLLADLDNRVAVAAAIDRAAVTAVFRDGWTPAEAILPDRLDSARPPTLPAWAAISPVERTAMAQARIARYARPVRLRIALPAGPGATLLYGQVGAALRRAGIVPERVGMTAAADLRLVDAVAPYDSARWYLRTACQPCAEPVAALIEAAREAPDVAGRAAMLARADAALAADVAFIPVARPLRWSLVARRLSAWTSNPRALHPLNHLRPDTN